MPGIDVIIGGAMDKDGTTKRVHLFRGIIWYRTNSRLPKNDQCALISVSSRLNFWSKKQSEKGPLVPYLAGRTLPLFRKQSNVLCTPRRCQQQAERHQH
jgi:hypothetical protein